AGEVAAADWLTIFPNPASTSVTVRTSKAGAQTLTVCNSLGQVFYRGEMIGEASLDVGGWSPGVYVLKVGKEVRKVVIE
ncbi:MAG: T9SS type A sorting domain-containing protein, partial [Bacteroidota bacterium]